MSSYKLTCLIGKAFLLLHLKKKIYIEEQDAIVQQLIRNTFAPSWIIFLNGC